MKLTYSLVLALCMSVCFSSISMAQEDLPRDNGIYDYHKAPNYRESESHPLRTLAYILHPIGWIFREGVYRPMSYGISSTPFTRSFFGYREPFDYREALCFGDTGIPNCRQHPPFNSIGKNAGDGAENSVTDSSSKEASFVQQVCFPDVAFQFDKSDLTALGKGRVRQIASLLASDPELKVTVEGHADPKGSEQYNQALGIKRSQKVRDELVELGIDPARLVTISMGESQPVFTEQDDWANAVNRRVKVVVNAGGAGA